MSAKQDVGGVSVWSLKQLRHCVSSSSLCVFLPSSTSIPLSPSARSSSLERLLRRLRWNIPHLPHPRHLLLRPYPHLHRGDVPMNVCCDGEMKWAAKTAQSQKLT